MLNFEHFERGYLLPEGCKDLMDVIKLQGKAQKKILLKPGSEPPKIKGDLFVSDHTTVREIAASLAQKPFRIIADLMELGVFANVNQALDFEIISQIASKYGYVAKRLP